MRAPIAYRPDGEQPSVEEQGRLQALDTMLVDMARTVADYEGHAHRAVHAKGQGALTVNVEVPGDQEQVGAGVRVQLFPRPPVAGL
jgi:hypothetical protein